MNNGLKNYFIFCAFFPQDYFLIFSKKEMNFNIKLHQISKALDCSLSAFEEYSCFCDILQCLLNSVFQMLVHTLLCKQPSESFLPFTYFIISLSCFMVDFYLYVFVLLNDFPQIQHYLLISHSRLCRFSSLFPLSPSNMCTLFLIPSYHVILQFWLYEQSVFK